MEVEAKDLAEAKTEADRRFVTGEIKLFETGDALRVVGLGEDAVRFLPDGVW